MSSSSNPRHPKPYIPQSLWEPYKQCISHLYLYRRKAMKDIQEIMAREHNFHATDDQYWKQFTKWELRKRGRGPQTQCRPASASGTVQTSDGHEVGNQNYRVDLSRIVETRAEPRIVPWIQEPDPWCGLRLREAREMHESLQKWPNGAPISTEQRPPCLRSVTMASSPHSSKSSCLASFRKTHTQGADAKHEKTSSTMKENLRTADLSERFGNNYHQPASQSSDQHMSSHGSVVPSDPDLELQNEDSVDNGWFDVGAVSINEAGQTRLSRQGMVGIFHA